MSEMIRLALSLVCAVLVTLLPMIEPPAAQAARPGEPGAQGNQGLQGGWAVDESGQIVFLHSVYNQIPLMREARAGWVRINFRLGGCFKDWTSIGCNGKTAVQTYDALISTAASNNLKVVGILAAEAQHGDQAIWTANNAELAGGDGSNPYIEAFATDVVTVLAEAFKGRVTHWEIWNEPNAWTSLDPDGVPTGGSFIHPSNFAQLLRQSRAAVQGAGGVVIAGAIFSHDPEGQTTTIRQAGTLRTVTKRGTLRGTRLDPARRRAGRGASPEAQVAATTGCETVPSGADYLCSTYDMGRAVAGWETYKMTTGTYPLDHVGQNIYVDQGGTTSSGKLQTHLQELRNAYTRFEGTSTAKKTWVQEIGWVANPKSPSSGVSTNVQAQNLQTAYGTFRSTTFVARAFWFNVQDIPEARLFFGLVDTNGKKKSSLSAYQTYASY